MVKMKVNTVIRKGIEFKTVEDGKVVTYKLGAVNVDGQFEAVFFRENSDKYIRNVNGGPTGLVIGLWWTETLSGNDVVVTRDPTEVLELLKKE